MGEGGGTQKKNKFDHKEHSPAKKKVYTQKTENRPTYCNFGIGVLRSPTSPNFKTHNKIFVQFFTYLAFYGKVICKN